MGRSFSSDKKLVPRSGVPFAMHFPRVFELLAPTCPESLPAAGSKGPNTLSPRAGCGFKRCGIAHHAELYPANHFGQLNQNCTSSARKYIRFCTCPSSCTAVFPSRKCYLWPGGINMKHDFRNFPDDRFALTTLQNPLVEVRTYAEPNALPAVAGLPAAGAPARRGARAQLNR